MQEDVREMVILLHERKMKVIVDVNMSLGSICVHPLSFSVLWVGDLELDHFAEEPCRVPEDQCQQSTRCASGSEMADWAW